MSSLPNSELAHIDKWHREAGIDICPFCETGIVQEKVCFECRRNTEYTSAEYRCPHCKSLMDADFRCPACDIWCCEYCGECAENCTCDWYGRRPI